MRIKNERVGRVDHRWLGWAAEDFVWMLHQVAVELALTGNQHSDRRLRATTGTTGLLPH